MRNDERDGALPTGGTVQAVTGLHREAVSLLFERFAAAIRTRDADGLRALMVPLLRGLDPGTRGVERESYVARLDASVLARVDVTRLATALTDVAPRISPFREVTSAQSAGTATAGAFVPRIMAPGDWLIEISDTSQRRRRDALGENAHMLPARIVVRWVHGEPRIYAIDDAALIRR